MPALFFQPPAAGASSRIHWSAAASYLMSGLLLHAITLITLVLIVLVTVFIEKHPLKVITIAGGGIIAAFAQLDARSRFQEFKQIRDQLIDFGPDRRIFRSVAGSRCRRDAALAAARQLGYEAVCRNLFTDIGYRWYHLLPDRIVQAPRVLLTLAFWRATFFVPGYHSRYPLTTDEIFHASA
ncbi:uncharacterized protein Dvar_82310 [Desulfosarcina variabilis str. Montpellier]|uniref:hypothetical protein n=1 Tax=Desulfosarcina variabilis TaxID=2300 RepID=UPI003AFAB073